MYLRISFKSQMLGRGVGVHAFLPFHDGYEDAQAPYPTLYLKRMGRTPTELWYDAVDMTGKSVLVIEWTHGNSDWYEGVDIPVLLNSTPAETLAHRQARNRDGRADSPFTTMVLELEQQMLKAQAHKAKLILSKAGEIMTYEQYTRLMAQA